VRQRNNGAFNLLETMSPEAAAALVEAAALAEPVPLGLSLDALKRLDADVAAALAAQRGELRLGVTSLSPEAAAALGMTPKAIEGRIGRARAKLAALIDARSTE
jgi:DNA-directed RNA polymerase specialized sigma24 family protein